MSTDLDWSRLEQSVARAAARLEAAARENQSLRDEVARLEAELQSARGAAGAARDPRADEVRRRLERLEGELESLLGAQP
jgi:chromosome segregation ATPase